MSHPFASKRQHLVERSRAKAMAGGGEASHADVKADRALVRKMVKPDALKMDGAPAKGRLDKRARGGKVRGKYAEGGEAKPQPPVKIPAPAEAPKPLVVDPDGALGRALLSRAPRGNYPGIRWERQSGGRVERARGGKVGKTNINIIVTQPEATPPVPLPALAGAGGMPPPPMPPAPPMAPPVPPMRNGGRAYASGGSVKAQSIRNGTPVQHSPGKNDTKDLGRGKPITYAKGGKVKGYPLNAGSESGVGRLEKTRSQKRMYP